MSSMYKRTTLLLSVAFAAVAFVYSSLFSSSVLAQTSKPNTTETPPFTTRLDSQYSVSRTGQTIVKQTFILVNKTPTVFVKNYGIKLSSSIDPKTVEVTHNDKAIEANVISREDGTSIGLSFAEPVVGEGKTQKIVIQYPDANVAQISGQVLEVHVPKLSDKESFSSYEVEVRTPELFGPPTHGTNPNYQISHQQTEYSTVFKNANSESLSLYFGNTQAFDATLDYTLSNPETGVRLSQIALPPDTPWQRVHYRSLEPQPQNITTDLDGNWIATYELQPQSEVKITALVQFQLSLEPDFTVPQTQPLPLHTHGQTYWDTGDQQITQLAQQYNTPKAIHQYVVNTLEYFLPVDSSVDENTVFPKRAGGVGVLAEPSFATCQEFTDLFITVARAANIPSRRITGYAYTQNSQLRPLSLVEDVLHAWPEYYDATTSRWRPIDPTWEKTTKGINYFDQFDLNHLVFAINGASSTTPYPAGSYKAENNTDKAVDVSFAQDVLVPVFDVKTQVTPVTFLGLAIPGEYNVQIHNNTGTAWYGISPEINLENPNSQIVIELSDKDKLETAQLLPWQTHKRRLSVYTNEWWPAADANVQIQLNHQNVLYDNNTYKLTAGPKIWAFISNPATLAGLGIGCLGLAVITGSILVSRRKRARSLRR